jgi:1,4-alpha-glucan branching enzyme
MKKCSSVRSSTLSDDPFLDPFRARLQERAARADRLEAQLTKKVGALEQFACAHEYFGLHRRERELVLREWAPNASEIYLIGPFCEWRPLKAFGLRRIEARGVWELRLPANSLRHGDLYRLRLRWADGEGDRIPAYARRVVQDAQTGIFSAQVWMPPAPYVWQHPAPPPPAEGPLVYEAHIGMAQEREGVGSYEEFRARTLPRIREGGYNTLQLMALTEHPYYASFGYHVSSFFAASSRFGTPDELKALIDEAHALGLRVLMDLVHSHAVKNEVEGLSRFDGRHDLYFHAGPRGDHVAWDSRCFDYGNPATLHFLLSNCRYWLDEYRLDGFRFDGVTSMLYRDHGLETPFDGYPRYFDDHVDEDALAYLTLANTLVHRIRPTAVTVAEDVSGMPGLAAPRAQGGAGFDYRLAMGVPDCWFKLIGDTRDEDWNMDWLWHELTNRRAEESTISYVESHDQALVGGKTAIFTMMDEAMYRAMGEKDSDPRVARGMALHKMMRLVTLASAGGGYLNFMGNEFGHPEWVDFPRAGNDWSYRHARRLWSLRDRPDLKYRALAEFDRAMLELYRQTPGLAATPPRLLLARNDDKVLAFERGGLYFFFCFHPERSFPDYAVEAPTGRYHLILHSDEPRFGGHDRLTPNQIHHAIPLNFGGALHYGLRLYLPNRCGMVLKRL